MLHTERLRGTQISIESAGITGAADFNPRPHITKQGHFECPRDRVGDVRLQLQNVTQVAVIGLRPQVKTAGSR